MITAPMVRKRSFGSFFARIESVAGTLIPARRRRAVLALAAQVPNARTANLFARALHENSTLELDWLWYAANMTRDLEKRFCLERALQINPNSEPAKRALNKLAPAADAAGARRRGRPV